MIKLHRHSLHLSGALLLLLASAFGGHAQQQAEAAGEPIELTQHAKTVVIQPGRRISVHGPPGTSPIKGKLVTMTDSIVVRPDNIRYKDKIKKVAVSDVRGITRRRIGWQVAAMYIAVQALYALGVTTAVALSTVGVVTGVAVTIVIAQALYWFGMLALFLFLGYRRHNIPPWKIFRRGS